MTEQSPSIFYRKDYRPPAFLINTINLSIELGEQLTHVAATLHIQRNPHSPQEESLTLNGQNTTLRSLSLNGQLLSEADYRLSDDKLIIFQVPSSFSLVIENDIKPQENTSLEGLYKSRGTFCTQCEAEGFRKITYFLDRPDVMAIFTTTVIADKKKYPTLLSNGNLVDAGELDEGRHFAKWHDPFKKPAYLFALVAGNLRFVEDHFITMSGRNVALRIYVEEENLDRCDHAMASVKQAMQWDEERFGREYDLDIFMLVAISDFNMGAMENKGLNIFNSSCILAKPDTATDADYDRIQAIIAHEYFHNWTGNRITCRDWFQLSLKEGLTVFRDQEFSADMSSPAVKRIADVRALRSVQFVEDSGPMAHAVRPDSYIEINNFYTATIYNKGAEIIRMMQTLLGRDGFRRGMDLYFNRYDGQAVTIDDFISAMEQANKVDLSQFSLWYSQAGTPLVEAVGSYDKASHSYNLRLTQHCPSTPGQADKLPFYIPIAVALIDGSGNNLPLQLSAVNSTDFPTSRILPLCNQEQNFKFLNIDQSPVLSILRGFSAPIQLRHKFDEDELLFLMENDSDDFNRWEASQELAIAVLKKLMNDFRKQVPLQIPCGFLNAYRKTLLNTRLDKLLIVQSLMLPSNAYLGELMDCIDVEAIDAARLFLIRTISEELRGHLLAIYDANYSREPYHFEKEAVGRRSMKNLALHYLSYSADPIVIKLCFEQLTTADNMTDAIAALMALVEIECEEREQGLTYFYQKWHNDSLVIDKWLAVQSSSRQIGTLQTIQKLLNDPVFEIKNPNKVRALLGSFCFGNLTNFHIASGSGYEFITNQILLLDALNPQIAARLVSSFSKWRKFDPSRQTKMQSQLQRIINTANISNDTYEIAAKSLA